VTRRLEAADHEHLFVPHGIAEHTVDLGEIRMNYATLGDPDAPALLLIPAQTESWWGYEAAMRLLADRFQVFAVDLRGQGRSTWTPGRYTLDVFGGDLVRFIDRVIRRTTIVAGLSSGGTIAAWLSAYAAPGQVAAAYFEDAPLFASEADPAVGQSIRQGMGPVFALWHKWLGPQWSIGDWAGMLRAMPRELPAPILAGLEAMAPAGVGGPPSGPPQDLKEYDPEWGHAFVTGRATAATDHADLLGQVKVPVLFSHHLHTVDERTGTLLGALSDLQVRRVEELVTGAGNSFTYRAFPEMPHSMHGHAPELYAATLADWIATLDLAIARR
jgi:pimeloyl-ACP methyl ester carboxylesterase